MMTRPCTRTARASAGYTGGTYRIFWGVRMPECSLTGAFDAGGGGGGSTRPMPVPAPSTTPISGTLNPFTEPTRFSNPVSVVIPVGGSIGMRGADVDDARGALG